MSGGERRNHVGLFSVTLVWTVSKNSLWAECAVACPFFTTPWTPMTTTIVTQAVTKNCLISPTIPWKTGASRVTSASCQHQRELRLNTKSLYPPTCIRSRLSRTTPTHRMTWKEPLTKWTKHVPYLLFLCAKVQDANTSSNTNPTYHIHQGDGAYAYINSSNHVNSTSLGKLPSLHTWYILSWRLLNVFNSCKARSWWWSWPGGGETSYSLCRKSGNVLPCNNVVYT